MASISWTSTTSGDWDTASNWSTGTLPGPGDDVTISTGSPLTVTHSMSTDVIGSLVVGSDTLAITGGSLTVLGNATLNSVFTQSGGFFGLNGANAAIVGKATQTAGTLNVGSGTLTLSGAGNSFAGTLSGAIVDFASGSDTLASGLVLSVAAVEIGSAAITLAENVTVAGLWEQSGGTLTLQGFTLTETGTISLEGGTITGSGAVAVTHVGEIANAVLEGSVILSNSGSITQTGYLYVGIGGGDTPQLNNLAGATYILANDGPIYGTSGGTISNAGTLTKLASGQEIIYVSATSTGTIDVVSGTLDFNGATNSFTGAITGGGTLGLIGGADAFGPGLSLTVAQVLLTGGSVTLGASLTDAGSWTQTNGTLALGGFTFTESNTLNLEGGIVGGSGTLDITKSAGVINEVIEGTVVINNTGSTTQNGYWYIGYNGADTVTLANAKTGVLTLANNSEIYGTAGSTLTNAGTLVKTDGGASYVYISASSTNVITVSSGVLVFQGAVNSFSGVINGAGELDLSSGTDSIGKLALAVSTLLLSGADVTTSLSMSYAGRLTETGGTLALGGNTLTTTSTLNLDGGYITGSSTLNIDGAFQISGGALAGSLVVNNASVATVASSFYIGYNSGDTVAFHNAASGAFNIASNAQVYGTTGSSFINAGKLVKEDGGSSQVQVSVTSTNLVTVAAGLLDFTGATNSFSGTVNGLGTFELGSGTDSFGTISLGVSHVLLGGANLTTTGTISYAGELTQTSGSLSVGGTLTASGTFDLDDGVVNGAGTLDLTKSANIDSGSAFEGAVQVDNTGTVTQSGYDYVGYNSTDAVVFDNAAAGTYLLEGNAAIYTSAKSSFSNAGTFIKRNGGTSQINAAFSNTGTLSVASGALVFAGGTSSFAGTVGGAGALYLSAGADVFASGLALSVGSLVLAGTTLTLAGAVSYGGNLALTSGTLALGGQTLSTTGAVNLDGGVVNGTGTLAIAGSADISTFALEGKAMLSNTGTLVQTNYWYVGYNSTDVAKLVNHTGATLDITGNSEIYGIAASQILNGGTIAKTGGAGVATIDVATVNTGVVSVGSGGMTFIDGVSGSGNFDLGAATSLDFNATVAAGSKIFLGAVSELFVNSAATLGSTINDFAAGNLIELTGLGYAGTSLAFNAATDKLTVTNGSYSNVLTFAGSYTSSDFRLVSDHGIAAIAHS